LKPSDGYPSVILKASDQDAWRISTFTTPSAHRPSRTLPLVARVARRKTAHSTDTSAAGQVGAISVAAGFSAPATRG